MHRLSRQLSPRSSAGFTLAEVQVSLAILLLALAFMGGTTSIVLNIVTYNSAVVSRDRLQMEILRTIRDKTAIQKTRQKEKRLNSCFMPTPHPGPPCESNTEYGLNLYDAQGQLIAGRQISGHGSASKPVYYDDNGRRCGIKKSKHCRIAVTASFRAQGPLERCPDCAGSFPATVPPAGYTQELIEIRYRVEIPDSEHGIDMRDSGGLVVLDLSEVKL